MRALLESALYEMIYYSVTFLVPSLKNTASIFLEIFFIQYSTDNCKPRDAITFLICIIQQRQ